MIRELSSVVQALDLKRGILDRIQAQPGRVWTAVDLLDLGPRAAVDKALQRLATENTLGRIVRGLYFLPSHNALTGGPTVPHQAALIDAVARRDQMRVLVDGLTAANDLGLTTAVPARVREAITRQSRVIARGRSDEGAWFQADPVQVCRLRQA